MSSWKEFLQKERKPGENFADVMKRMYLDALRDLENIKKKLRVIAPITTKVILQALEGEDARREKISQGTRRGLAEAKRKGVKLGGNRRKSKVNLAKVRALRKRMTHADIAKKFGVTRARISQLLRKGKRR